MKVVRSDLWIGAAVFALALAVRLIFLAGSADNPTFELPIVDSGNYCRIARLWVEEGTLSPKFFYQPFFYPAFLSALFAGLRSPLLGTKLLQAVLGAFTCLLTACLGRKIFDRWTGILAGAITVFYGPLIFFGGELVSAAWAAFWSVVLILLFLRTAAEREVGLSFLLGLSGGLAVITRPTFLPFLIAASLWLAVVWFRPAVERRFLPKRSASLLAGFLLIALPVAALNHRATGRFSILPAEGGLNFFIGNNPDSCETVRIRPGWEWELLLRRPAKEGEAGSGGESRFYYRKAAAFFREEPLSFLGGLADKALQFVSSREIPRNVDIYLFRRWSSILSLLVWKVGGFGFPFGILFPLALVGLISRWKKIPAPFKLFILFYPLSIIIFHVSGRYRLPVVPAAAVLAAAGVVSLIETVGARKWRQLGIAVAITAAAVLLSTVPGPFCQEEPDYESELYYCLGNELLGSGRGDEAVAYFAEAVRLDPSYTDARVNLGNALARRGVLDEAIAHYSIVLKERPQTAEVYNNIGNILVRRGEFDEAVAYYETALKHDSDYADGHTNLGIALARQGKLEEATAHYLRALAIQDDNAVAYNNLGNIRAHQGRYGEAAECFRKALEVRPGFSQARSNLARALRELEGGEKSR